MSKHPHDTSPDQGWHSRGYLPHFEKTQTIQSITYRLADSLPSKVVERLREELKHHEDAAAKFRRCVEEWLDAGHGSCVLREPRIANLVMESWKHFHGKRYWIHAFVVMPNHVHVMAHFISPHTMADSVESWKRYTATNINRMLGREGKLWQEDYWDRYIRDESHYQKAVDYLHNNPVKARLVKEGSDWKWSSALGVDLWERGMPMLPSS